MKIHLIGLALLACSAAAQAQHDISTNFLGLLTTNYSLAYEMNIQGDMGARIESSLFTTTATVESENGDSKDFDWQGFRLTPEYRFYFSNDKPGDGFFVAPYLRYRNRTLEGDIDLYND